MKKKKEWMNLTILLCSVFFLSVFVISLSQKKTQPEVAGAANGFDEFGYNRTARIFNGTGSSWCQAKGLPANCMGAYSPDKLVMKWTADWDRGNAENWSKPPYDKAWEDNEWNGNVKGGSQAVWHYKIKWVGPCGTDNAKLPDGGYCIWGQFETVMDQGKDPRLGPGHLWFTHANPAGYGMQ